MPELLDEAYFQQLLEETQARCREYELPDKDRFVFEPYPEVKKDLDAAHFQIHKQRMKNKNEEEKGAATQEHKRLTIREKEVSGEVIDVLYPMLDEVKLNEPEELKVSLMQCCVLKQAGPKQLATFCQEEEPGLNLELFVNKHGLMKLKLEAGAAKDGKSSLVLELLHNKDGVLEEMLESGGAKNGKWAQAYQLYTVLINMVESDTNYTECQKRLAMAVALEHAEPAQLFDEVALVDPIARFQHYAEAHKRGELDACFGYLTTWELRHAVNCNARDEQLQWGRDHLKRYRPDQVAMKDMTWRYSISVKSDVGYRQAYWPTRPKTYAMLVSNGGKCGPRAWYGRYIAKAHGIPTWGVRQPQHAAMTRWTPTQVGWDTSLGGGWHKSNWENRQGNDFRTEAHARAFQTTTNDPKEWFLKVALMDCMAEAHDEPIKEGQMAVFDPRFLWRSLANVSKRVWEEMANQEWEESFSRGPAYGKIDDTFPSCIQEYCAKANKPINEVVSTLEDGTIRIPAFSFSGGKKTNKFKCFEGGGSIHMQDVTSEVEYKIPEDVSKQDYELTFKICTIHIGHEEHFLCIHVNDQNVQELSYPYTVGEWGFTAPIIVDIGKGDILKVTRKGEGRNFGMTVKEILLKPCFQI
jgi:hypothetical protein